MAGSLALPRSSRGPALATREKIYPHPKSSDSISSTSGTELRRRFNGLQGRNPRKRAAIA